MVTSVGDGSGDGSGDSLGRPSAAEWSQQAGDPGSNEAIFRVFADQLPIMVFQQDVSGAISYANAVWHATLGMPRDPASYSAAEWTRIIHPDDIQHAIDVVSAAIPDRQGWTLDYRLRQAGAPESDYRWYAARGVPYFTNAGAFRGWTGSIVDVHEARLREEAERKLRVEAAKGEREFRALADTIPVMLWIAGPDGAIEWYNRQFYEYTGTGFEQMAGWGWQGVHHPDDFQRVMETWPRSVASGEPWEIECRLRRFDGEFRTFLTRAVPVRDESGKIARWYGSNVDIQEQREALERSKGIAERLQGVFLPGALPRTPRFRVDAVYQAAERDALVGGDWFDAVALPDGRHVFSIGDVTGHGIDASIVALRLRNAIVDFSLEHGSPAQVLESANRVLRLQHPDTYATALVAFLNADATTLTYASAGHHPPLIAEAGRVVAAALPAGGLLLGAMDDPAIGDEQIAVPRGAVVALYTDGLIEFSHDLAAAERALARAVALIGADTTIARPATAVRDAVLAGAVSRDDLALVIVQFSEVAPSTDGHKPEVDLLKTWRFHSSDAHSAHASRHELMNFIRPLAGSDAELYASELILGELLANTVEHAPGLVEVQIDWTGEKPVVRVADTGPGLTHVNARLPLDFMEDGRGLFLVESLADEFRVESNPQRGTKVLVVLPLRRTNVT
jgi:PAS domain S-box-containing protein